MTVVLPDGQEVRARPYSWHQTPTGWQGDVGLPSYRNTETTLCAWLSLSTFAGLLGYAVFRFTWLDAVAGFLIAAFAVSAGREAWEGELACDDEETGVGP